MFGRASVMGQTATLLARRGMSALPLETDILLPLVNVCLVPLSDLGQCHT